MEGRRGERLRGGGKRGESNAGENTPIKNTLQKRFTEMKRFTVA